MATTAIYYIDYQFDGEKEFRKLCSNAEKCWDSFLQVLHNARIYDKELLRIEVGEYNLDIQLPICSLFHLSGWDITAFKKFLVAEICALEEGEECFFGEYIDLLYERKQEDYTEEILADIAKLYVTTFDRNDINYYTVGDGYWKLHQWE